ncbi:8058_t:CDS:1, partial [Scutellospora calospora]
MNSFLQKLEKRKNKLTKEDRIEKPEVSEECTEKHKEYKKIQVIDERDTVLSNLQKELENIN